MKLRPYFEIWGLEQAQNKILKVLLLCAFGLCALLCVAVVRLSTPLVVGVGRQSLFLTSIDDSESVEARNLIIRYLGHRHNWSWQNVEPEIRTASSLVTESQRSKMLTDLVPEMRVVTEKKLTQRFHPIKIDLDSTNGSAQVIADRVLLVDSVQAVTTQRYEIRFRPVSRSQKLPEGIEIVSETLLEGTK